MASQGDADTPDAGVQLGNANLVAADAALTERRLGSFRHALLVSALHGRCLASKRRYRGDGDRGSVLRV
jgi:hypothetical protein